MRISDWSSDVCSSDLDLKRAYVNDGGDIALHLALGESLACGMVAEIPDPRLNGRAVIAAETPIRGIATSGRATLGQGGRSFSLGIADAVNVFAPSADPADVAEHVRASWRVRGGQDV